MQTVQDLISEEQQLEQRLQSIKDEKEQAGLVEKGAKLDLIESLEAKAESFRLEALEAKTADARKELYSFAADNQNAANSLRAELGIAVEIEVQDEETLLNQTKKGIRNKILSLLISALVFLVSFFIADFQGGKLEGGFFPYVLKYFASIFFLLATVFGRFGLVCSLLFYFLSDYISRDFTKEFSGLKPIHRISIIVAIVIALLYFLNSVQPHAI